MLSAILVTVVILFVLGSLVLARHCHYLRRMVAGSGSNRSRPVSREGGGPVVLPVRAARLAIHTVSHSEIKRLRNRRASRGGKIRPLVSR